VCVCERESACVRKKERKSKREREQDGVCVCGRERAYACERVFIGLFQIER